MTFDQARRACRELRHMGELKQVKQGTPGRHTGESSTYIRQMNVRKVNLNEGPLDGERERVREWMEHPATPDAARANGYVHWNPAVAN